MDFGKKFDCSEGGKHVFDQLDYDSSEYVERGHCIKCGLWINTADGTAETLCEFDGDVSNDCEGCAYSSEYHYNKETGECVKRNP